MRYYHIVSVNCRTGSLEGEGMLFRREECVNCRTGSLEDQPRVEHHKATVNCRTGSLEGLLPKPY